MYAVIITGGKQYRVAEGDVVFVEKLDFEEGETITLNQVVAVSDSEGMTFGSPYVESAEVSAKVLKQGKAKKIVVFKFKPKKRYKRKQGHRQLYTKILIEKISS